MHWLKDKKLLVQYIISYISVFLLPVLFLGWIMNGFVIQKYTEDILDKNTRFPHQLQNNFDMQIHQLRNYATQTGIESFFSSNNAAADPAAFNYIQASLHKFLTINSFISQIYYWPSIESNIIYSPEGTYRPDILFGRTFIYENMTEDLIREMINTMTCPVWLPNQKVSMYRGGDAQILTYIFPVENIYNQKGAFIFIIEYNTIQQMSGDIQNLSSLYNSITFTDTIIYASLPLDPAGIINIYTGQYSTGNDESWNKIHYNGEDLYIYEIKSNFQPITYYSIIPVNDMLQQITSIQRWFNLIMLAVILVCSILALFLVYNNYKPIKNLVGLVQKRETDTTKYSNELDAVQAYLNELSDASLTYTREHLFFRLLKDAEAEADSEIAEISRLLPGPYFRVLYLSVIDFPDELSNTLKQKIQSVFAAGFFSYVIELFDRNTFAVVCSVENASEGKLAENAASIMDELEKTGIYVQAAAGKAVDSVKMLKKSFTEAKNAYNASGPHKHGCLLFAEPEGLPADHSNWYIAQELDALRGAIEQVKPNLIEFTSSALVRQIQSYSGNRFIASCICYDVINTIFDVMSSINSDWRNEYFKYITESLSYDSTDDLVMVIKTLCSRIINETSGPKKTAEPTLKDMIAYIDSHYNDPNFSIK